MATPLQNRNTLVIDKFQGSMTIFQYGDINSGRSWAQTTSGQNPFALPNQLTWMNNPVQIDAEGSVITDLIMAGKERVESGILYVYAIGHTGRLYKIQVNDPTTYNPNYDNPVLLATLTANSPTFKYGGFIDFFGSTEKIFIGHDKGVTMIDFNGTGETFCGVLGSWTQNVPRPLKQFGSKLVGYALFAGNGNNIATINSTGTVVSYAQISPAFYANTQVRDMDLSVDGNYLEMVVTHLPLYDITSTTQETSSTANSGSYIIKWNGIDAGATSSVTFPNYSIGTNTLFQQYQFTTGTDQYGMSVYAPYERIWYAAEGPAPLPNAVTSSANQLWWMMPIAYGGFLEAELFCWGSSDFEVGRPVGLWDMMFMTATEPETDVIRIPLFMSVSNAGIGPSSNSYTSSIFGKSKFYFSTLETSATTSAYRFYRWDFNALIDEVLSGTPLEAGVYQTQTQMFSKKVSVSEVRVYGEPWTDGVSFQIDLMGSSQATPITNGSKVFTVGTNINAGDDYAWYGPDIAPSYALGVTITNLGTTNFVINKIEIDYGPAGK